MAFNKKGFRFLEDLGASIGSSSGGFASEKNAFEISKSEIMDFTKLIIQLNNGRAVCFVSDIEKILGISQAGAYRLFKDSSFPSKKINGKPAISALNLAGWICINAN